MTPRFIYGGFSQSACGWTTVCLIGFGWSVAAAPASAGCGDHLQLAATVKPIENRSAPVAPPPCFDCGQRLPNAPAVPAVDVRPSVEDHALATLVIAKPKPFVGSWPIDSRWSATPIPHRTPDRPPRPAAPVRVW